MAIAHLHTTIVQRSAGQSAVGAAAYAARARILDERTGVVHDYSRKNADVMFSFVGLPNGAPDRLLDPSAFANALEARETRINSQTARKFVMALPHELTAKQREWLVKDFGRENFTRKGLAYHVAIHRPHEYGDQRNIHAHWTVSTRFLGRAGFAEKDRVSNGKEALLVWRDNWEKLVNRHLERHGHTARISMKTLEAQGIDRTPQIHMGQGASALERKGNATEIGDRLRDIANDNTLQPEAVPQETADAEIVDRDEQDAAWQEAVDQAGIEAYAEAQRRQFLQTQATDRATFERQGEAMAARHATSWGNIAQRHHDELAAILGTAPTAYQPGTIAEAGETASTGASFFLSLFTSWAEGITSSLTRSKSHARQRRSQGTTKQERAKQQEAQRRAEQQKEAQTREIEAMAQEQARERESYERRRALMLFQQAGAMQSFEQAVGDKSSMRDAFEKHTEQVEGYKAYQAEKAERTARREGRDRDGPELGL